MQKKKKYFKIKFRDRMLGASPLDLLCLKFKKDFQTVVFPVFRFINDLSISRNIKLMFMQLVTQTTVTHVVSF